MELLEEKKKHRGNELAVSLFLPCLRELNIFLCFFFVLLDIMKGHLLT